jgi:predicted TIM-barrel fold metal-dependent hydrolase
MQRFCYDTASATTIYPLAALVKLVKTSQILFGTDHPFTSSRAVAAGLRSVGLFSAEDLQAIERGNAARIMPRYRT